MGQKEVIPLSERILEWVLFRFRWIFVILFVLPASLVYDQYFSIRNWIIFKLNSAPKAHDRKVAVIQKQVGIFFFNLMNVCRSAIGTTMAVDRSYARRGPDF
jgi:hypothetical protein